MLATYYKIIQSGVFAVEALVKIPRFLVFDLVTNFIACHFLPCHSIEVGNLLLFVHDD